MAVQTPETGTSAETPIRPSEEERVYSWRMERFWELGFTLSQSENLSGCGCDWHEADRLLKCGCLTSWTYKFLMP